MKTNIEWLSEMEEPERSQAIENCKNDEPYTGDNENDSIFWALGDSFIFAETPQGWDYWESIRKKYDTDGTL